MSIQETYEFDNSGRVVEKPWFKPFFLPVLIVLVALLSFGVGRLTAERRSGVVVEFDQSLLEEPLKSANQDKPNSPNLGEVTASVNGTRYYYSHCKNNISDKNKVTFATALLAEEAGYTLALNCKLK